MTMTATPIERDENRDVARHRPRLLGLAYRMLGDLDDAEDVVQEGYLRWHREPRDDVRAPEAWLVTVVSRLAVDRLRRAAAERASYPGPWLPEPVATPFAGEPPPPDRAVEVASDLSMALLVLLERLAPEERAAFLLREVFGADYAEIARILERRPDAVRQMVHRARRRVEAGRPRVATPPDARARMLERFVGALAADDAPALLALLAPGVTMTSDGGGQATAARNVVAGPDRVSRFLLGIARKLDPPSTHRAGWLNGEPALLTFTAGRLVTATILEVLGEEIRGIYVVRNPAKLRRALDAGVAIE
jgi:RNA polymerase sigma-70 factor (ECF subfamily)